MNGLAGTNDGGASQPAWSAAGTKTPSVMQRVEESEVGRRQLLLLASRAFQRESSSSRVEHPHDWQRVAEGLEVLEGPNDLLLRRDLDDLRVGGAGVAVDKQGVATG